MQTSFILDTLLQIKRVNHPSHIWELVRNADFKALRRDIPTDVALMEALRRYKKSVRQGHDVNAELHKNLFMRLVGRFANEGAVMSSAYLSTEYIPRPNARRAVRGEVIKDGTIDDNGNLYLARKVGGKGEYVSPMVWAQSRPLDSLQALWNSSTRDVNIDRAVALYDGTADRIIREVELELDIKFPKAIKSQLTIAAYKPRKA